MGCAPHIFCASERARAFCFWKATHPASLTKKLRTTCFCIFMTLFCQVNKSNQPRGGSIAPRNYPLLPFLITSIFLIVALLSNKVVGGGNLLFYSTVIFGNGLLSRRVPIRCPRFEPGSTLSAGLDYPCTLTVSIWVTPLGQWEAQVPRNASPKVAGLISRVGGLLLFSVATCAQGHKCHQVLW